MKLFRLDSKTHTDQSKIDQEFSSMVRQLSGLVSYAARAPHSKDKGIFFIHRKSSTIDLYIRDTTSGTWRGPTTFS